jgi:hypothetical protein
MIEEIKTIGSLVGLITGIVVFYDRIVKARPIASLTITTDGSRKSACIRLTNVSPYDIAVVDIQVTPPVYFLTEDLGVRNLIEAAAGYKPAFMLKPSESKELVIAPRFENGVPIEIVKAQRVNFLIFWRRGNATWLPQIPVWVITSTTIIRKYGLERPNFTT